MNVVFQTVICLTFRMKHQFCKSKNLRPSAFNLWPEKTRTGGHQTIDFLLVLIRRRVRLHRCPRAMNRCGHRTSRYMHRMEWNARTTTRYIPTTECILRTTSRYIPEMECILHTTSRYIPATECNSSKQGHPVATQKALIRAQVVGDMALWKMKQAKAVRPRQWSRTWWRAGGAGQSGAVAGAAVAGHRRRAVGERSHGAGGPGAAFHVQAHANPAGGTRRQYVSQDGRRHHYQIRSNNCSGGLCLPMAQ